MSTFIGQVRHSVIPDDCDVVDAGAWHGGKLILPWRNQSRVRKDQAQQQLDDLVTVLQRVARQNGLVWPKEGK